MKKSLKIMFVATSLLFFANISLAQNNSNASFETNTKAIADYSTLKVHGHYNLNYTSDEKPHIVISSTKNAMKNIEIMDRHNHLSVGPKASLSFSDKDNFNLTTSSENLKKLQLTGKGTFYAHDIESKHFLLSSGGKSTGFLNSEVDQLNIKVGGDTVLHIHNKDGKTIQLYTGGKSIIYLSGETHSLSILAAGDTKIFAKNLDVKTLDIKGVGKLQATVDVDKKVKITFMGQGILNYYGQPHIEDHTFGKMKLNQINKK